MGFGIFGIFGEFWVGGKWTKIRVKNVTVVKSVILAIVISPGQSDSDQALSCCVGGNFSKTSLFDLSNK